MQQTVFFTEATEAELDKLLAGKDAGHGTHWPDSRRTIRLSQQSFGVIGIEGSGSSQAVRPVALVVQPEQQQRLFGRMSRLRGDLSPLSSWLHLVPPHLFDSIDSPTRPGDLAGLTAAWVGLIVAEASLGAGRSSSQLKLVSCLASQSYAVARALSLWPRVELEEVLSRFDSARNLLGPREAPTARLRPALMPIWSALTAASFGGLSGRYANGRTIDAILSLQEMRQNGADDESYRLSQVLSELEESRILVDLDAMPPEARVRAFDAVVQSIKSEVGRKAETADALSFLGGYIASKAAGGTASLGLAAESANEIPAISAWAHVIGGIGEPVTWTSSFDGLGRLISRELERPVHLIEPPTCDFQVEEAHYLVDRQLSDPLVHLKIKQNRSVNVALLPGVDIAIPLTEGVIEPVQPVKPKQQARPQELRPSVESDPMTMLADALWPYLEDRFRQQNGSSAGSYAKNSRLKSQSRAKAQGKLPLDGDS